LASKVAMVAGFGDVSKGSAASLRQAGCRVMESEVDPICALQAAMEGYEVITMEDAAPRADIEIWTNPKKYEKKVYTLPKHLDEKVARLHLDKIGAKLTRMSEKQATYIGVPMEGPYKPEQYRY
jgi:S-adenosylhomocysteine hydrolase